MAFNAAIYTALLAASPFAYKWISKKLKIGKGAAISLCDEGFKALSDGNYEDVLKLALKANQINRNSEKSHYLLGRVWLNNKDYDKALVAFNNAYKIAQHQYIWEQSIDRMDIGKINRYKQLTEIFAQMKSDQDNPDLYFKAAVFYYDDKEYQLSLDYCNKAASMSSNSEIQILTGKNYYKLEKYQDALNNFSKAFKSDSSKKLVIQNIAATYFNMNEFKTAIEWYNKFITAGEPVSDTFYQLGRCYMEINEPDNAKEQFQKALNLEPNHFKAREYLKKL